MRLWILPSLALLAASPALAHDSAAITGYWTGPVTETVDGDTSRYTMSVRIDLDRHGRPVATVSYDLPCTGIWSAVAPVAGSGWRFEETITDGRDACTAHGDVEATLRGDALHVRIVPVGYTEPAEAILRRR